jgi:hypothetical protein
VQPVHGGHPAQAQAPRRGSALCTAGMVREAHRHDPVDTKGDVSQNTIMCTSRPQNQRWAVSGAGAVHALRMLDDYCCGTHS